MSARTDIASESALLSGAASLSGVKKQQERCESALLDITRIEILSDDAAEKVGKPRGRYLTLRSLDGGFDSEPGCFNERARLLAREIRALLPEDLGAGGLFAGLGNRLITPDCIGPLAADRILATRHIESRALERLGELARVSVISPGVTAQTGLESAEVISLISGRIRPSAVIVCDAFACAELDNLAATVQLSDTGISPGSGVNNSRAEISQRTLGLPCIAVGIPTVADIAAVTDDPAVPKGMIMTPGRIDTVVSRGAALIALSVNLALHKSLTVDEINSLVG